MTAHASRKSSTSRIEYPRFKIWIIVAESVVLLSNDKVQNGFKALHGKVRLPHENLKSAVFRVANWLIGHGVAKMIYHKFDSHIEQLGGPVNFSFYDRKNKLREASCQHYKIELPSDRNEFMNIVAEHKKDYIEFLSLGDFLKIRKYDRNRIPFSGEIILFPKDIESVKNILVGQARL